ncbi:DUF3611 family protein [Bythopirellula polymerisocia]|uniref:DUF3611 domain-containing protein n=1 Tax=Bythopirellula polymerisocia TaxID=2528003 RepID=A0A5C6D1U2_9BACT|nr:DUF3611 family protein [Bythopirellula polymerisocia]TWU29731.1 hypothetical protein Pla144_05100 [Bythopirellula polymerisocia]
MFKKFSLFSSQPQSIAKVFSRLGWIGFWLQLILAALPILLMIYVLFFCESAAYQRGVMGIGEYLGLIGLAILMFTIFWSYRYTRLARRIADPDRRPPKSSVEGTLWIGLWASCLGILFSMLLMVFEVGRLLFIFLRAPQGGVPVMRTETANPSNWVSAIDMVGLLADLSVLAAELLVLAFTLWLLFRMTKATEYDQNVA